MISNLKALIIVLALAGMVFHFGKPIILQFMAEADFVRRRNLWILLTIAAFVSPSFWIFAPVAALLAVRAARHDPNPVALFIIAVSAAPPVTLPIPTVGIGSLFDLNHFRLLGLAILLPVAARLVGRPKVVLKESSSIRYADIGIFGLAILQMALLIPYQPLTTILRQGVYIILDGCLIYYVFSRTIDSESRLRDALAALVMTCCLLAPLAVFETLKFWLLYQGIGEVWGKPDHGAWLMRGESLRAQTSGGHSLYFGYFMALGFGIWLTLAREIRGRTKQLAVGAVLAAGLAASFSRAPWLAALLFTVVFVSAAPMKAANRFRFLFFALLGLGTFLLSPWGGKLIDLLPFVGTVDDENVIYRQRLATESWNLIFRNPLFGDPLILREMEHLRQGQGIIDLVNSYLAVTLFNGVIGLVLFTTPLLVCSARIVHFLRRPRFDGDRDGYMGATLLGGLLSMAFFIATCGYNWHLFALIGLAVGYIGFEQSKLKVEPKIVPSVAVRREYGYRRLNK